MTEFFGRLIGWGIGAIMLWFLIAGLIGDPLAFILNRGS